MYTYIVIAGAFVLGVFVSVSLLCAKFRRDINYMRNTNALLVKRIQRQPKHKEESTPTEHTTRNAHNTNGH